MTGSPLPSAVSTQGVGLSLLGVRRVFGAAGARDPGVVAVESLSLEVAAGDFVALLGPSGCGKSTLLRLVAGLDQPDAGQVVLRHTGPTPPIACVFQDAHLLPWRDVLGNVALPLELLGTPPGQRAERARAALEQVGLGDALRRYPAQLSGGMRMRASLARALVTSPRLLLLDEPFAALDEITRQSLDEQLRGLWARTGITVLFVTHSIAEAAFLAQRAVVLTRRPARVVLEHALALPPERTAALRGEAVFAGQMRLLYQALERGGGEA